MKNTLTKHATMASSAKQPGGERVDRFGAVASSLCAVHCAVCALLPAAFGALGLGFLLGHVAEWAFTLVAVIFASGALFLGWRRHRSVLVAGLLIVGIAGLLASRGLEMSGGHHGHHDAPHHVAAESAESNGHDAEHGHDDRADEHQGEHEDALTSHEDTTHLAGSAVGVLAGMFLLFGHLLNIRTSRRCREEHCA